MVFSLVDALGQMDGMCKCINVIRGAHNLMHKQRNLNDSTQPLWLGGGGQKNGFQTGEIRKCQ